MIISELEDPIGKSFICNDILRSLPNWFGIESAIKDYTENVKEMKTWVATENKNTIGFISIKIHNPSSAEIYVMAIKEKYHNVGIGKRLVQASIDFLKKNNVQFLQIKTLSGKHPDQYYKKTRDFYYKIGFLPLEEFRNLWGEHNPCLLMIKSL
jgi:ribosomal protein S18 acetylase RimI-like enzyme